MRWASLLLLLVARVAGADDLVFRPHTQAVADPDGKVDVAAVDAAIKNSLPFSEIACAGAKGKLLAWVVLDGGRVASVDVGGTKDKKHVACAATGLKTIVLPSSTGRVVAVVELVGGEGIVSTVQKIDMSKLNGTGTGVSGGGKGTGTGVGPIDTGGTRPGGPNDVKVEIGEPKLVKSDYTVEEVNRIVRSRTNVFRACYQKELSRTPDLAGTLTLTFSVNSEGNVSKAELGRSTMKKGESVETCVRSNVMRLKFPPKGGAGAIAIPFTFSKS